MMQLYNSLYPLQLVLLFAYILQLHICHNAMLNCQLSFKNMKQTKPDSHLYLHTYYFLPSSRRHLPSAQKFSLGFPRSAGLLVTNSVFMKIALFCLYFWRKFLLDIEHWIDKRFVLLLNLCKDFVFPLSYDLHYLWWEVVSFCYSLVGSPIPLLVAFKILSYLWFSSVLTMMC